MEFQVIVIDSEISKVKSGFYLLVTLTLALLITFSHQAHSAGKIVKWIDDKGVTHYGDNVPAQYANRENSEINKQGITIKRNRPVNIQEQAIDIARQEQDKKDKALLNAFTNANEIDLARDRNLQLDVVALESLQLQKKASLKKLAESQSYANNLIKKNRPVPADLTAEIKNNQVEVDKQEQQINERKATMDGTRKRFDDDKARFNALKNHTNEAGALAEAPPATKP
ncbi:MAG: DUF4124 domain-containing protein [Methylotenera sp.]|nr:DUF4124 domain-containing protein [Methylotenera sp.]